MFFLPEVVGENVALLIDSYDISDIYKNEDADFK
jgi:hypothetical protein